MELGRHIWTKGASGLGISIQAEATFRSKTVGVGVGRAVGSALVMPIK